MFKKGSKEISSVSFGIFSADEIINMSVCKVDSPKKIGYGTVYDPRMGTTNSGECCETCGENAITCPGHFGHIELNYPIVHPLLYKKVLEYLHCFCVKCNRLLLTKNQIYLYGFNRYKGQNRMNKIKEKAKKVEFCCHEDCNTNQPKFRFHPADSSFTKTYDNGRGASKISINISVEEIKKMFDNIILFSYNKKCLQVVQIKIGLLDWWS